MAIAAFAKLFPNGRGLLNGRHLNDLFTGNQQMQAINVSGNVTAGSLTTTGATVINGSVVEKPQLLTAAGTTQLGAAAILATVALAIVTVAATASTHGVRLPTAVTGKVVQVANAGAFGVKVYPSTNGKIGAASTNANDTTVLAVNKANTYTALNKTFWVVNRGA